MVKYKYPRKKWTRLWALTVVLAGQFRGIGQDSPGRANRVADELPESQWQQAVAAEVEIGELSELG
jgi:hypothetical protein